MDKDELFELFYTRVKSGLTSVESGGDYSAKNKRGSSATGKYQFTKEWLSPENHRKNSIQSFAKSTGVYEVPRTMEDFRNNPGLQDAYFRHYTKNVLFEESLKLYKGKNPLNLSLDQIGALNHLDGYPNARKQIASGKLLPKDDMNMSREGYLDKFDSALKKQGIPNISKEQAVNFSGETETQKQSRLQGFIDRDKAISALGDSVSNGEKERLRRQLNQEVVNAGYRDIYNKEYIEKENKQKQQEIKDYRELIDLAQKIDVNYFEGDKEKGIPRKFSETAFFVDWSDKDIEQRENLRKKHDFFLNKKGGTTASKYDNFIDQKKLFSLIQEKHKTLTGEDIKITPGYDDGEGKLGKIDTHNFSNWLAKMGTTDLRSGNLKFSKNVAENINFTPRPKISNDYIPESGRVKTTPEGSGSGGSSKTSTSESNKKKTTLPENPDAPKADDVDNAAEQWFGRELSLDLKDDTPVYGKTKGEFNFDAVTGLALGLIGKKGSKVPIPLRTEQVSEAMKNFTAELAHRSKNGLPVEVEAAMKNQLAEAYQGGLENIVRASGGNRALVLGNLGQLEQARNKGMVGVMKADYEAKEKAFAQYGKAIEYINDFDTRRDIANHGILYTEAKEKQKMGRDLATAGFAQLKEALAYQKENGPGSANDMYRSYLMQNMFGFDPKMKDDGTGNIKGTKSYFDKQKGLLDEDYSKTKQLHERFNLLNPNQKKVMNRFIDNNTNKDNISGMIDYLVENPELDTEKLTMDNLDLAVKNKDYGMLSMDRISALRTKDKKSPIETETPSLATPSIVSPQEEVQEESLNLDNQNEAVATNGLLAGAQRKSRIEEMDEVYNNYYENQ